MPRNTLSLIQAANPNQALSHYGRRQNRHVRDAQRFLSIPHILSPCKFSAATSLC